MPTPAGQAQAETWMREAIAHARTTPPADVPCAALIYGPEGNVLARATNRRETDHDPTAHAEVLAIRQAVRALGAGWRLEDCTLVVTLEPCTMCAGALVGARVGALVFGAFEPKTGAVGSVFDVIRDPMALHQMEVRGGVLEHECAQLLRDFFAEVRGGAGGGVGGVRGVAGDLPLL
nr:nucleoside deaminase [Corynebacterium sp. 76QC2CO]